MSSRPYTIRSTRSLASSLAANPPYRRDVLGRRGGGQGGTRGVRVPPAEGDRSPNEGREALLLRPIQVAEMLGLSRSKVFELMAARELPVVRIGRATRVVRHELERWIDDQTSWKPRASQGLLSRLQGRSGEVSR